MGGKITKSTEAIPNLIDCNGKFELETRIAIQIHNLQFD